MGESSSVLIAGCQGAVQPRPAIVAVRTCNCERFARRRQGCLSQGGVVEKSGNVLDVFEIENAGFPKMSDALHTGVRYGTAFARCQWV
jgi:hypothetical protein